MNLIALPKLPLSHLNVVTYDTMHSVTLPVQDWLGLKIALVEAAMWCESQGWAETAKLQRELLERLGDQVSEQINAAGEAEEAHG